MICVHFVGERTLRFSSYKQLVVLIAPQDLKLLEDELHLREALPHPKWTYQHEESNIYFIDEG